MSSSTVVDHVPAAGAVEAEHELAVSACAEGVLDLVAVAQRLDGGHDRLDRRVLEAAEARRGRRAPGAPSPRAGARRAAPATARRDARHTRLDAVGARLQRSPPRGGLRERALGLLDARAHGVARHAPRTNTTKPSARPTPAPPWASESMATSTSSPRRGRGRCCVGTCVHRVLCSQASCPWTSPPTARRPRSSSPRSTASTTCTTRGSRTSSRSRRSTTATPALFSREAVDGPARGGRARAADRVRGPGPDRPGDQGGRRPSWRGGRRRSSSSGTARRCPIAPPRCCRPTSPTRTAARELEDGAQRADCAEHLNPLSRELLERSHELARELGWPSMRTCARSCRGTDLGALAEQTERFLDRHRGQLRGAGGARAPSPARAGLR